MNTMELPIEIYYMVADAPNVGDLKEISDLLQSSEVVPYSDHLPEHIMFIGLLADSDGSDVFTNIKILELKRDKRGITPGSILPIIRPDEMNGYYPSLMQHCVTKYKEELLGKNNYIIAIVYRSELEQLMVGLGDVVIKTDDTLKETQPKYVLRPIDEMVAP